MDSSIFDMKIRKRKEKILFPEGLPSAKKGRFALFVDGVFVTQGDELDALQEKALSCEDASIIDLSIDFSQQCFF